MENESRQGKIAGKRKRKRLPAGTTTSVHDLSDDLLELVLLGVDSPACLVRAAATCKLWRRVIAGAGGAFLRRFRSLHPPRPIGTYYSISRDAPGSYDRFHLWPDVDPVFVPSPAAASPPQISLDFVPPAASPRELVDGRGSLLLLLKEKDNTTLPDSSCWCCDYQGDNIIPDLVVCEPLTRRYQAIPPPDHRVCILGAFLLDGAGGGAIGMTNFRVLLVLYEHDTDIGVVDGYNGHGYPCAAVFTCGINGGWQHGPRNYDGVYLPRLGQVDIVGRTGGCIYWAYDGNQVMVLDEDTLEFSTLALSEHMLSWNFGRNNFRVVSRRGIDTVQIVHLTERGDLEVFSRPHGTGDDWEFETSIQLVEASRGLPGRRDEYFATALKIIEAEEALLVLSPSKKTWLFSVNLESQELKREYSRKKYTGPAFPYTLPWPPVMRVCVDDNGRKRRKRRRKRRKRRSC